MADLTVPDSRFYVYGLYRDAEMTLIFYIGKGIGDRWNHHERPWYGHRGNTHKERLVRKVVLELGYLPKKKIYEGLSERDAFQKETEAISLFGRYPEGVLVNKTDGGEGASGNKFSDESKDRLSKVVKAHYASLRAAGISLAKPPGFGKKVSERFKGVPKSPEHRAKISEIQKRRSPEVQARMTAGVTGLKASDETKRKMGDAHRGRVKTLEEREKLSKALKGRSNWHKGRPKSAEQRAKIGAAQKGKIVSEETRARQVIAAQLRWEKRKASPEYAIKQAEKAEAERLKSLAPRKSLKGIPKSAEAKRNMNAARIGRVVSAATREKHRLNAAGKIPSAETKEKMSAAQTAAWARRRAAKECSS